MRASLLPYMNRNTHLGGLGFLRLLYYVDCTAVHVALIVMSLLYIKNFILIHQVDPEAEAMIEMAHCADAEARQLEYSFSIG